MSYDKFKYRSLRRDGDAFTLTPKSKDAIERNLCAKCSRQVCDARDTIALATGKSITADVTRCEIFVPGLTFRNRSGLIDGCNTMRIGDTWASRVRMGDEVGLALSMSGYVFGRATVSSIEVGDPSVILSKHSRKNHLFIEQKITKVKAALEMSDVMPSLYGNLIWHHARQVTAIYLDEIVLWNRQ